MISQYRIVHYENDKDYVVRSSNEIAELVKQLWQYHQDLSVEAYQADSNDIEGTLKWELQGHWYTTSQIERIMKIRVFL